MARSQGVKSGAASTASRPSTQRHPEERALIPTEDATTNPPDNAGAAARNVALAATTRRVRDRGETAAEDGSSAPESPGNPPRGESRPDTMDDQEHSGRGHRQKLPGLERY